MIQTAKFVSLSALTRNCLTAITFDLTDILGDCFTWGGNDHTLADILVVEDLIAGWIPELEDEGEDEACIADVRMLLATLRNAMDAGAEFVDLET